MAAVPASAQAAPPPNRTWSEDPELPRAVAAAVGLELENRNLRHGRSALVRAADAARLQLERNLHDGAQQRLVGVAMLLAQLRGELAGGEAGPRERLAAVERELTTAIDDLRVLARGMHPPVLAQGGLEAAVRSLVRETPLRVAVRSELPATERPDPVFEAAAYFVVCEALANTGRHADASSATVAFSRCDGNLTVTISDDGRGGADSGLGTGLGGLRERVESLGGRLALDSPQGAGTRLRAELPWRKT